MRRKRRRERRTNSRLVSTSRSSSRKAARPKKKSRGILKTIIYGFFICVFVAMIAGLGVGAGMYAAIVQEIEEMNVSELPLTRSSIVFYTDADGNSHEAATLFSDGNCIWVESNEIADVMKEAMVAIEDERFYTHNGVDLKRSGGAILGFVREKLRGGVPSYGGSTITQQMIKNITQEKDRTVTRKIKEMMRAVAIEKELSKDEIITTYLNVIYLANNCYGVEAAANLYFDKSAAELNLTEAALIAGITQRPAYYDPIANPENALEKRNTVLYKMHQLGKISDEEYDEATASDLGLNISESNERKKIYSYFIDTLINDVIRDLQTEKGYTESFATQQIFSGGLKIYATVDMDVQNAMEEIFENNSNFPSAASDAQAAMIVLDQHTGEIKGIVGGRGVKTDSRGLNRATQARRQPGSSIKPLSVYSPAIEAGLITSSTRVRDEEIYIKEKKWEPKNAYSGFKGTMTVKKAVEISANIPAIKVLLDKNKGGFGLGVNTSFDYVKNKYRLGVVDADRDLSPLALGGLTNGTTTREMAAAYAVFANKGMYNNPVTYTKVLDSTNRVLLENTPINDPVISEQTAYVMCDLLHNVVYGSSGTGKLARLSDMPAYGKTGTTNDDHDKWFVGFTAYYTGAVWFGFDQQRSIRNAGVYDNISARLWKKVMENINDGKESREIVDKDDLVSAYVCTNTGKLAKRSCDGERQYFIRGTEPTEYCSGKHSGYHSSSSSSKPKEIQTPSPEEAEENAVPEETADTHTITEETPSVSNETETEASQSVPEEPPASADDAITLE